MIEIPAILSYAWLIPAIMAGSFLAILFLSKSAKIPAHFIGIPAIVVSFVLALVMAGSWIGYSSEVADAHHNAGAEEHETPLQSCLEGEHLTHTALAGDGEYAAAEGEFAAAEGGAGGEGEGGGHTSPCPVITDTTWFEIGGPAAEGGSDITIGTLVDGQAIMLLVVVTFISMLVHIYSTDYVAGDRRYTHYFAFLSLFTGSMLFMVLSVSTIQLIVGWELVGVCSFVLIGHWWEEKENSNAALKAFLTNRVGDIGLLVGMIILYFAADRSFDITTINSMAVSGEIPKNTLLIASLCLMAAVMSKSGQFVLHTWLPDAMAGPTPVSALIHAATMVVAGVYLIGRLYAVFFVGFGIEGGSFNAMAFIGGLTCIGGGALAFVQRDIKKVLAYSTVSQLGYMVLALGVGAYTAGMFHLFTHAIFKACLFLGAGSVSHACHHSFDMKSDMGGLKKYMPKTFWTFVIASGALAGIPPLAGFWSKDEILVGAGVWPGTGGNGTYWLPFIFGMMAAAMTAGYMARAIWLTFFGEYRGHGIPHESGPRITTPLIILAFGAVVVGFLNVPTGLPIIGSRFGLTFEKWVEPAGIGNFPVIHHANASFSLAIVATGLALATGFGVWSFYKRLYSVNRTATEVTNGLTSRSSLARAGYAFLSNKYYLDHFYSGVLAAGTKGPVARGANWLNQNVLDRIVNSVAKMAVAAGRFIYRFIDQGAIDGAVNAAGLGTNTTGQVLRRMQTGQVRQYATLMFGAAALLAAVFIIAV